MNNEVTTIHYEKICKNIPDEYIQNKIYDAFLDSEYYCGKGKYFIDTDQCCHAWIVEGLRFLLQKKLWDKQFWNKEYKRYLPKEKATMLIKKENKEYQKYRRDLFKSLDKDIHDCSKYLPCPVCNKK